MKKKMMWIVSMTPLLVTSFLLQFLPEQMPMHHDLQGNVDRYGNKVEQLIFPIVILVVTGFWQLLIYYLEKKSKRVHSDKEAKEAIQNSKLLGIVAIGQAVIFSVMHFCILYGSYLGAVNHLEKAPIDIAKVSCFLLGVFFIVIGNFLPKAKNNSAVGVRTVWSAYNDNTWRKCNRFGAVALIFAGVLTVVTTVFASGNTSTVLMLVYILTATIITIVYSKIAYDKELGK